MKIRNLNGAIRGAGAKILIRMTAPDGRIITFPVSRSDAVASLKEAYPEGSLHETHLAIGEDCSLMVEGTPPPPAEDLSDDRYTPPGPGDDGDNTPPPGYGHFVSAASLLDDDDDEATAPPPGYGHFVTAASLLDDDD